MFEQVLNTPLNKSLTTHKASCFTGKFSKFVSVEELMKYNSGVCLISECRIDNSCPTQQFFIDGFKTTFFLVMLYITLAVALFVKIW